MEDLAPMSKKELAEAIEMTMAVLRARKEIGRSASDGFVASQLVERLWLAGMRPFKLPGQQTAPASQHLGYKS